MTDFMEPSRLSCSNMLGVMLKVAVSSPMVEEGFRFRGMSSRKAMSALFSRGVVERLTRISRELLTLGRVSVVGGGGLLILRMRK